ncbi:condensin complex protein MksE [Flavobacterium psychrotrophum]|uniref:condensin complex protein MksE n=1 Tax=Flavobacterium psychrotrophum TaxID=2294119 RepID=UPI000E31CE8D|nr:hypothetical protein [Flavobacterium psychrotrophum]
MTFPDNHKEIVRMLMDGKFITADDTLFESLDKKRDFYKGFFLQSFGYELIITLDYIYLVSDETQENTSRDIAIFFAILCYELDKDGKNFLTELRHAEFHLDDIADYFKKSSWTDVINANKQLNTPENVRRFVSTILTKRNIAIRQGNERYTFTKAHKLFIDFAKELASNTQNESNTDMH